MYRIIIADDEPLIIRGLKKMMEWGKDGHGGCRGRLKMENNF